MADAADIKEWKLLIGKGGEIMPKGKPMEKPKVIHVFADGSRVPAEEIDRIDLPDDVAERLLRIFADEQPKPATKRR